MYKVSCSLAEATHVYQGRPSRQSRGTAHPEYTREWVPPVFATNMNFSRFQSHSGQPQQRAATSWCVCVLFAMPVNHILLQNFVSSRFTLSKVSSGQYYWAIFLLTQCHHNNFCDRICEQRNSRCHRAHSLIMVLTGLLVVQHAS